MIFYAHRVNKIKLSAPWYLSGNKVELVCALDVCSYYC